MAKSGQLLVGSLDIQVTLFSTHKIYNSEHGVLINVGRILGQSALRALIWSGPLLGPPGKVEV